MFQYLRLCVVGWFRSRILQTQSSRTISFLAIDCINLFLDFGFLFLFFGLHEAQGRMCWWPCYYGSFDSEVWSNHAAWRLQWIQTSIPDLPIYNEYFGIVFIRKKTVSIPFATKTTSVEPCVQPCAAQKPAVHGQLPFGRLYLQSKMFGRKMPRVVYEQTGFATVCHRCMPTLARYVKKSKVQPNDVQFCSLYTDDTLIT